MAVEKGQPAIFGEVLYDRFPDGMSVLGGAPFNVSWHLHGLGMSPLIITAVGDDQFGERIIEAMQEWGMDASGIQVCEDYPTGQVDVSFASGEPHYDIKEEQAYDHIDSAIAQAAISKLSHRLLYHGSLVSRSEQSHDTLIELLQDDSLNPFVDVNLRAPWWKREQVQAMLQNAKWVKLNEDELATVMGRHILSDIEQRPTAQQLFTIYGLELLVVTLGSKGAFFVTAEGIVQGAPVAIENMIDTVGAGDSFTAVMITGILNEWPMSVTLRRALDFAAEICQIQGATTTDKKLYDSVLEKWQQ